MPSRRVLTNNWTFWLAKHPLYGLILFDKADQDGIGTGEVRVFEMKDKTRCILPQALLKTEATADVTDRDFVKIVNAYNELKELLGMQVIALSESVENLHKKYLKNLGLPDNGIRHVTRNHVHRVTHCWSCSTRLNNFIDIECVTCGWIICGCGACGCGFSNETSNTDE